MRVPGSRLWAALLHQRTVNAVFCSKSQRFRYKDFLEDTLLVYDYAAVLCALSSARTYDMQLLTLYFGALPSRRAAKRHLRQQAGPPLNEPGLTPERMDGVVNFYKRLGYHLPFFYIAHDASACLPRVRYDLATNTIVGLMVSDDELPSTVVTAPDTYEELLDLIERRGIGTQVELYCLKPAHPTLPTYILACFLQTATPNAAHVQRRLETIKSYLKNCDGLVLLGYSADGAPAHLKAMENHQQARVSLTYVLTFTLHSLCIAYSYFIYFVLFCFIYFLCVISVSSVH